MMMKLYAPRSIYSMPGDAACSPTETITPLGSAAFNDAQLDEPLPPLSPAWAVLLVLHPDALNSLRYPPAGATA